jgi:hypothetical protein
MVYVSLHTHKDTYIQKHTCIHVWPFVCLYIVCLNIHLAHTPIFFIVYNLAIPHLPHDGSLMFVQIGEHAKAVYPTFRPTNCFV